MTQPDTPRVMSRGTAHTEGSLEQTVWDVDAADFLPATSKTVERYAIDYTHKSGCDVEHHRLPAQEEMQGMDLAFRERPLPGDLLRQYTMQWMLGMMAAFLLGGFVLAVSLPLAKLYVIVLLPISLAIGTFAAFACVVRRMHFTIVAKAFYYPPLVVASLAILSWLAVLRIPFLFIFSLWALHCLQKHGNAVFQFYEDWLLTDPRLLPADREKLKQKDDYSPSLLLAGFIFFEASIVGFLNHFIALAIALLALVVVFSCQVFWLFKNGGVKKFYRHFLSVMAQYLAYGRITSGAPGVWIPEQAVARRKRNLLLMITSTILALTYTLDGFVPIELVQRASRSNTTGIDAWIAGPYSPMGWVFHALSGYQSESTRSTMFLFPLGLFISMVTCPLFFLTIFAFPIHRSLKRYEFILDTLADESRPEWQWYVDRMKSSNHVTRDPVTRQENKEAAHLFLGVEPLAHHPVMLDRKILSEHAYIVGESGSGKTSMGVMPILMQLIRGNTPGAAEPNESSREKIQISQLCESCGATIKVWGPAKTQVFKCPKCEAAVKVDFVNAAMRDPENPPPPILIIDLKGDPALFHTTQAEAEARSPGSFRWFTPEKGFSSHVFNPFEDFATADRSVQQVCELFMESLGLAHGDGYGRSYFTRQNRVALMEALKADPPPRSFEDLVQSLIELERLRPDDFADIAELTSTIRVLMEYPQLALGHRLAKPEQAIHMPAALEHRQVVYFWLPAALESVSVREIAKLALYSFLSAAIARQRNGEQVRQSYLIVDEFQRIVGDNFRIVLEQARSFGIGVMLSNQTQSDLVSANADLRPTVNTNTRLKMIFSMSDPKEISDLRAVSGEEMIEYHSTSVSAQSQGGTAVSVSAQNSIQPRLSTNEILSISNHPLDFIMQVSRSSGYTQYGGLPVRVRTNYPISSELYSHRTTRETWPELELYELKDGSGTTVASSPAELESKRESFAADFEELLEKEFSRQQERFTPDDSE